MDKSLKGTLAFHPLFARIQEELLDALCEDCRVKVGSKFNEYLGDAVLQKEEFKELALHIEVPVRDHPDLIVFLRILNKVVWGNEHLECYARFWARLRQL